MIIIEDGTPISIRQTKEGVVLVIGNIVTTVSPEVTETKSVVHYKKKNSKKGVHLKKGIIDANGEKKWLSHISEKTGGKQYILNPKFNASTEVEEHSSMVAHLGQYIPTTNA